MVQGRVLCRREHAVAGSGHPITIRAPRQERGGPIDELLTQVAAGDRGSWARAHAALVAEWEENAEGFDQSLDRLAVAAAANPGPALELLLTVVHQLGLARPGIVRVTVDQDHIEEAAQATLVAIERGISSFEQRSAFRTWLFTVARNQAITVLRRASRAGGHDSFDDEDPSGESVSSTRFSSVIASRKTVADAINSLPEHYATVLQLRVAHELEYQEIADELDIPIGTVRSRISKARDLLSQALAAQAAGEPS